MKTALPPVRKEFSSIGVLMTWTCPKEMALKEAGVPPPSIRSD
jgi:hypothetical protein